MDKSEGIPVSPSLTPVLAAQVPPRTTFVDSRVVLMSAVCIALGVLAYLGATILFRLIALFTNLAFYGQFSTLWIEPAGHRRGEWVMVIPVIGGVIIGLLARFGSTAVRGHGIPEAMERVLVGQSRVPAAVTILKPLSAAISIGTGGPFGVEGPIIATGGALGSVSGQFMHTSTVERKTLLAAGAAAGMAATFGSPIAAVLLAVELLLFEYRPRSLIPVAIASVTAASIRAHFEGLEPVFSMPHVLWPTAPAIGGYAIIGLVVGFVAVCLSRTVIRLEHGFEKLPIHWMWWPALGAVAVGICGVLVPTILGVGMNNITEILSRAMAIKVVALLCVVKFIAWSISLASGTSGGTMAPLFTMGSALGLLLGTFLGAMVPWLDIDLMVAGAVGMGALFAGASRAYLASILVVVETTHQPALLPPLLAGCTASFLVSCLMMRQSIMTEGMARRGVRVPTEYAADLLDQIEVRSVISRNLIGIGAGDTIQKVQEWFRSGAPGTQYQGFPIIEEHGFLVGVLTRKDLLKLDLPPGRSVQELLRRPPVIVYADCTLREAVEHMVNHDVGRLPVVSREHAGKVLGMITRSDILSAYRRRLDEMRRE